MSIEYTYGERIVRVNDDVSLKFVAKSEEHYFWDEVYIETETGTKQIGSYFTDPGSRERMLYNSNYAVFLRFDPCESMTIVTSIFDIHANQMIEGTHEELLEIYNREFNDKEIALAKSKLKG